MCNLQIFSPTLWVFFKKMMVLPFIKGLNTGEYVSTFWLVKDFLKHKIMKQIKNEEVNKYVCFLKCLWKTTKRIKS